MTYEELKARLTSVETTLHQLQTAESKALTTTYVEDSIQQLNIVRENILSKMKILEEGDETMFVSTKGGDTKAVKMDRKTAMDLKKDPAITGIDTAKGAKLKEDEGINFSKDETKSIAKSVGKALIKALKKAGDEVARIKAHRLEEGSFDIHVIYKGESGEDEFSFYITDDTLHLVDFSFDKKLIEVGVKPSGEAIVNVDVLTNEFMKHFRSLNEGDYDPDQEQKDDEEDHGVGYDDEGRPLGEGFEDTKGKALYPVLKAGANATGDEVEMYVKSLAKDIELNGKEQYRDFTSDDYVEDFKNYIADKSLDEGAGDDHHYIKVKAHDYKKAMAILDQNVDPTYVKMEVVDNDGAGNVIIYFIFKHEDGFDDMYDDSENPDSEFYQEPDEDPQAFIYDVVMDLRANDIELADHSADMDEATDFNDPVLMKMRVAKKRNADLKKVDQIHARDRKDTRINGKKRALIKQLKAKRADIEREMENDPEIEPTGGPVADRYGNMLNKIDNAIEKAAGRIKPLDYDTAVGKINEGDGELVTFGYDLDMIQQVVDHLQSKYKEGEDFELHIGRGDDLPNAVTLKNPNLEKDYDLNDMLNAAQSDEDRYDAYTDGEDTDYAKRRKEGDDYYEDPDYYKEGVNEESIAKISKGLDQVKKQIKTNLEAYKTATDASAKKAAIEVLKKLNGQKKQLEKHLDSKVAGTGSQYTEPGDMIQESASRDLDEIFGALGYRQGFDEFIEDNPGCVEVIMEWIGGISDFQQKLSQEYDNEELENLGFYFGDDDYNESLQEGRGDLDIIVRVITDMANEDGITTKEAALEVIEALRDAYMIDAYDEGVIKESLNPEVSKSVDRFIKAMAKRYGYKEQDAVFAIQAALKQRKFDGVNEDLSMKIGKVVAIKKYNVVKNQKVPVDVKITDYIKKPGSKDFVEYEHKGKKRKVSIDVFKSILAESKKTLKEFTDNSFKGSELIDKVNSQSPDMFGKQIFADLLPKGVASENDAIEALKKHDKSGIKARMGQYAPMFVHVQYHNLEHEGEDYRMHQTQYYNSNFKDKDPDFNPGVSKITLFKITKKAADRRDKEESDNLGTILVKTGEYVQDLNALPGLGKRVSEVVNELDDNKSKALVKKAVADINGAMFKFRHSNPLKMIAAKDKDLKVKLDSMHNAIFDLEKVLKAKDLFEATRQDLGMTSSVSKRRAGAELKQKLAGKRSDGMGKYDGNIYGLDNDGKRVELKSLNDLNKFKKFELDADINEAKGGQIMPGDYVKNQHGNIYQRVDGKVGRHDAYVRVTNGKPGKKKTGLHDSFKLTLVNKNELEESGPGFKHDCAAKVVHETYGKGNCIPEKHTLVKEGKKYVVTHYDVLFENGKTVEDIPVSELDIKTTNEHWHKGYKKKKK